MATTSSGDVDVEEAPWARWLFASKAAAWIWLVARVWLGYEWFHSGWEKITGPGHEAWMRTDAALKGFAAGAIAASRQPEHPQVAYGWWVSFLHWVADNAFGGLVLNFSYVFSGMAGVNPAFIIVGLLLVLAWRNAGWIGLDRFLLPRLGTPWQPPVMPTRRLAV